MIIIKKANAYSYHFDQMECECFQLPVADSSIPYFDVIFKIRQEAIEHQSTIFTHVLTIFSQLCADKSYFVPHFYFRVKDILLISDDTEDSLMYDLDFVALQKSNNHFFFTGNPLQWQHQMKILIS